MLLPTGIKPRKSGRLNVVVPLPLPQGKKIALTFSVKFALAANVTEAEVLEIEYKITDQLRDAENVINNTESAKSS